MIIVTTNISIVTITNTSITNMIIAASLAIMIILTTITTAITSIQSERNAGGAWKDEPKEFTTNTFLGSPVTHQE